MFNIIKTVIESKDYVLEDILYKIDKMYIQDRISEAEKTELDSLARQNAKAENSYNIQKQLDNIFTRLEALENKDKKYICKMDNCVWAPDAYPAGWEEVAETEENVEVKE